MRVEWDQRKAAANERKHGVGFEEARLLFDGDDYLEVFDVEHSGLEDRFIAIGPIRAGVVLIVFTERDEDVVRIISARWATRSECELYRRHVGGRR